MPKNILAEMGSQVGLTAARQNKKEAEEWARRQSGPMVNPSFEPDDFLPQSRLDHKRRRGSTPENYDPFNIRSQYLLDREVYENEMQQENFGPHTPISRLDRKRRRGSTPENYDPFNIRSQYLLDREVYENEMQQENFGPHTPISRYHRDREVYENEMQQENFGPHAPLSLSPVIDLTKKPGDKGIFMVNMKRKEVEEVEEYEPYDNRDVEHPTTNAETLLHLMKGSLGTGILAMPHAFAKSGYAVGAIGTLVIGVLCTYCIHVLIDSCYVLCKRRKVPSMTYTAVAEAALSEGPDWCKACAPFAAHIVNVFLLIYQIGTCCVYVVFVSENIQNVLADHFDLKVSVSQVMMYILIPLVLMNWVRDLKYLAPFSAVANIMTILSFGIILYYIFRQAPTFEGKTPAGRIGDFPLFFGTVLFALEAIGVILPLENEMRTPQDFVGKFGVLNRAMITIIIMYVGMGLFGYLQYGNNAAGSITLNLPSQTESLASVVQCLLAFAIFVTHGLACYVAIDILWNEYISCRVANNRHKFVWEYLLRSGIVLVTIGVAAAVPELDLFISLFGALCLSALGLAFPAFIQSCTYWYYVSDSERIRMIIKNAIVVIFGILGLVVGTWTSLQGIIIKFSAHTPVLNSTDIGLSFGNDSNVMP